MIRFIDIGDQIEDEEQQFAFFDTVTDRFIEVCGEQVWSSWDELMEDASCDPGNRVTDEKDRFFGLCPEWVKRPRTSR